MGVPPFSSSIDGISMKYTIQPLGYPPFSIANLVPPHRSGDNVAWRRCSWGGGRVLGALFVDSFPGMFGT